MELTPIALCRHRRLSWDPSIEATPFQKLNHVENALIYKFRRLNALAIHYFRNAVENVCLKLQIK